MAVARSKSMKGSDSVVHSIIYLFILFYMCLLLLPLFAGVVAPGFEIKFLNGLILKVVLL